MMNENEDSPERIADARGDGNDPSQGATEICGTTDHGGCASVDGARDRAVRGGNSPVLVEVTRGGVVESVHRGRGCVVDAAGRVLNAWGDCDAPVYPRSAIKPVQAIALLESGAVEGFGISDAEIALACSSHSGERRHTRTIDAWLRRMGLSEDDLECGPQVPGDDETAAELIRSGEVPSALHNYCSGKHAGFLAAAKHLGEPTRGYTHHEHPIQRHVMAVLGEMADLDIAHTHWGVDGCSVPTVAMPLRSMAFMMARMADPSGLSKKRGDAVNRINKAWAAHGYLIAGRGVFDTEVLRVAAGSVLVKQGAEGVAVGVVPRLGLGIALKIDDGSERARNVAMAALIRHVGALNESMWRRLEGVEVVPVMTRAGRDVGMIRPAADWLPRRA